MKKIFKPYKNVYHKIFGDMYPFIVEYKTSEGKWKQVECVKLIKNPFDFLPDPLFFFGCPDDLIEGNIGTIDCLVEDDFNWLLQVVIEKGPQ